MAVEILRKALCNVVVVVARRDGLFKNRGLGRQ